ncbi:hypothetical protein JOQ06_030142 [Pogonophryne albipinna]|uniref:SET domain-containing protein n=1 Tax=Pogonophryne albipinna TaxID=1090488 RepID=A0AAD6B081_9TELE|nr:hypothetical protein JOQ06_030142 [Pogonophryne albipinna]
MPPRVSPLKDAQKTIQSRTDNTNKLDVKYINAVKGRGIIALGQFSKGDFVLEYRGDLITDYHPTCAGFLFSFKWRGKTWSIDASREDGSFGRLVNDDHLGPNCRMKRVDVDGKPHLCLFAIDEIKKGEEITYDYGGDDCPWRVQAPVTRDSNPDGPIESESADTRNAGPSNKPDINREAPVTRDSNPDGPIESESADTRNAGPSNKPDINREAPVTRDSNPDGPIESESADTRNAGPSNKPDINREAPVTRDSNPDGPIESESADTRNAGPSNKPDINREAPVTRDSNPDGPIESESADTRNAGPSNKPDINREAPVTRDSNPDGPIESESADTRNAGPSNKPDINREAPVTRDSNPDGPIESESADTRNAGPSNKPDINREIKDTNLEEPDELYDSSSDISGSGDEFVPDSTSESEDSDSTLTMTKKRPSLMDLFDGLCDTTLPDSGPPGAEEPCTDAMTESDGDTRYQTGRKRQSPADSLNVPACDSTKELLVVMMMKKKSGNIEEGNCASAVDEETLLPTEGNQLPQNLERSRLPTAEETLTPTEGNQLPQNLKRSRLPTAEETLTPTEGNQLPQNLKRSRLPTAEGQESPEVHAVRHTSKGKAAQKRMPWTKTETQAVDKHMSRFITSCLVPGKSDCEKCLKAEPIALKHRDWQTLKFYVHNRITAYKRQIQRK